MKIFKRFLSKIKEKEEEQNVMFLYVKCNRCGEKIKVRIVKSTDLLYNYNKPQGDVGYTLRKEILGNKCPNLIYAYAEFDKNKKMLSLDVNGGISIKPEEYKKE